MVNLKNWVPLRQTDSHISGEIERVRRVQEKSKIDDLIRKELFIKKRQLQRTTNQLSTYKVTNLLTPWVNQPPFKPRVLIKLP